MQIATHETEPTVLRAAKRARPMPTLERALAGKNARIADLNDIAEQLDAPLWVLFIPGLSEHPELLQREGIARIKQLVTNYMAMNDHARNGVDVLAEHYAQA